MHYEQQYNTMRYMWLIMVNPNFAKNYDYTALGAL